MLSVPYISSMSKLASEDHVFLDVNQGLGRHVITSVLPGHNDVTLGGGTLFVGAHESLTLEEDP